MLVQNKKDAIIYIPALKGVSKQPLALHPGPTEVNDALMTAALAHPQVKRMVDAGVLVVPESAKPAAELPKAKAKAKEAAAAEPKKEAKLDQTPAEAPEAKKAKKESEK